MAPSLTKDAPGTTGGKTFFGHPRGLATLFLTEMWERFSFYGLRALLVVYLVAGGPDAGEGGAGGQGGGLAMNLATATAIYSVYNAMVYLLTMPGGWFGDRLWGPRKTVAIGAGIIMLGHLTLALPGEGPFFIGLALVATGSGLLKANISKMVGDLYNGPDDPRRDGGFTVFYMGINAGSFVAPFIIGTVGQTYNWHLGFALAAVGMALGLIQFLLGSRHLDPRSSQIPSPLSAQEKSAMLRKSLLWLVVAVVFYGVVVATGTFTLNWAMVPLTVLGLIIPIGMLVRIKRDKELSRAEQGRMTGYIWFFAAAAIFWMIYDQGASTVQAFGDAKTSTSIMGWHFPSTWFQSINPLFIILLAPVFASLWLALNRRGKEPTTTGKFAFALVMTGASFFVFILPMSMASDGTKVSPLWLVLIFLMHTVAELCLSPVGLSVTTKLAPAKYASQLMGVWFLAVTAGDSITGLLSIGGADLSTTGVVAVEAALAVLAGFAVFMYRRQITSTMSEVQ
ncbi:MULTISPECIES: peptide MFS transporter [Streptomyces]|uniref:MFS transporter n=1 Tax=Streptomyces albus TaxID=1888 RepID=A0A8H1QRV7_9ACTN|nr:MULTISPECIES: oligopeptide:H+ symporter [Streptomyces]EPD90537.1 amino acid/peptide transporter (Peptide:H+ symporter) [Streptomyces sp. HPH0547]KPC94622.1 amino acid transporter [Streptomyces sp. NRRL F-6602]TGG84492.1 MFS transporter [Streptomyces albus]UVN56471.1 oligopeptide:H+ symporter [Streptomyces albus]